MDIELKLFKFWYNSGSSSVDDSGVIWGYIGGVFSGLFEGKFSVIKWFKEVIGGKKLKSGKLRKKGNMKINEIREDMDV